VLVSHNMELSDKLLLSMGGWQAFKEARAIHSAGRVTEAVYEPPVLKGKLSEGGRQFFAGLRMRNPIDVENLCPCRDSRVRGIICAHSLAVGLQVLAPSRPKRDEFASAAPTGPRGQGGSRAARETREETEEVPVVELVIEGSLRHLEAGIGFRYSAPGKVNAPAEVAALERLLACGFREEGGKAVLSGEDRVVRFFAVELPRLREVWQVGEGERFRHVTRDLVRIEPRFAIREPGDGWLDVGIHFTAGKDAFFSAADLNRLLASGQSHVRLKDGRIAVADPALAADLEEVLRDCDPKQERGGYRVAPAYRDYLLTSIGGWGGRCETKSSAPGQTPKLGPLKALLRPYQVEGAAWMLDRASRGLGGLLADEMGLGKTVQALAMIEALAGPVLVVCPSSLVWNWLSEAARFLPDLPALALDGPGRDRLFDGIARHRLIVTSYALLRRDIERYRGIEFSAVILDEAQHIKNPDSQNAKAACALAARSRFILTGTPVENSIRDLWSLFEFLLPGYLGGRADFRDRYEMPLLGGERGTVWARLGRRIQPYLLRRLKADILDELPDKIEQVIAVELTDAQRAAYGQLQQAARAQIDDLARDGAAGPARMKVLTALLRLRQACCDLGLLGAETAGGETSAKRVALRELLGEAIDGGHRVLVFSQFTRMLDLIGEDLAADGVDFCRLDGSTKNRGEVVQRFQTGEVPVFLISLKAGGVGLNLTAADTVIHFDPWWNPAVEAQATDRAHRIGQRSVVTSIKLIARDTVEERVLAMQKKKRELFEGAMDADAALASLGGDDLAELVR